MKSSEISDLLIAARAIEGRTPPTELDIRVWVDSETLRAMSVGVAYDAMQAAAASGTFIGIDDIAQQARIIRNERIDSTVMPCPAIDPDDTRAYLEWTRAWRREIGEGRGLPAATRIADATVGCSPTPLAVEVTERSRAITSMVSGLANSKAMK